MAVGVLIAPGWLCSERRCRFSEEDFLRAARARQFIVTRMGRDPKGLGGAKRNRATVPAQPGDAELLSSGSHEMRFDTSRSNSGFWFSSRTALSIPRSEEHTSELQSLMRIP